MNDDDNMVTMYEYHDTANNRIWYYTSSTITTQIYSSFVYGTSAFGIDWDYRDCLVCKQSHYWITMGEHSPDHPLITDNLDYIEYEAKKRGLV
jgi:hypothetical protein